MLWHRVLMQFLPTILNFKWQVTQRFKFCIAKLSQNVACFLRLRTSVLFLRPLSFLNKALRTLTSISLCISRAVFFQDDYFLQRGDKYVKESRYECWQKRSFCLDQNGYITLMKNACWLTCELLSYKWTLLIIPPVSLLISICSVFDTSQKLKCNDYTVNQQTTYLNMNTNIGTHHNILKKCKIAHGKFVLCLNTF